MEENKNAYSEVIEILKLLDDEKKLEALPIEMLEVLKLKANPAYKPQISKDIPLEEQNLQPETFSILAWITMKYWHEDLEEMNLETKQGEENKVETIEENSSQTKDQNTEEKITKNQLETDLGTLPIAYQDLKWYQKLKRKMIEFFHKIWKKHVLKRK